MTPLTGTVERSWTFPAHFRSPGVERDLRPGFESLRAQGVPVGPEAPAAISAPAG
jgi:hypothetical protein